MDPFASVLTALAAGPRQHDRLLRLHTPLGPDVLVAETLEGVESVDDGGFRFDLTALSIDAHLRLDDLLGQPVLLQWQTDGDTVAMAMAMALGTGPLRPLHGHVTRIERVGSNGGLARYALRIEPWLAFLRQRVDSFVFQGMTVMEIVESVFADYVDGVAGPGGGGALVPAWRWALKDATVYRKRSLTTQYGESDLGFVERLLAEEGIAYWFEHEGAASVTARGSGTGAEGQATLGAHTLVLGDHPEAFAEIGAVRHHRSDATERRDGVHTWSTARRWRPVQVRRASWDYKTLDLRVAEAGDGAGGMTVLDDDTAGPYAWPDRETGDRYAQQQAEALQVGAQVGRGAGTWRHLRAGARFQLVDAGLNGWLGGGTTGNATGRDAGNAFTCLRVHHRARNNLGAEIFAAVERALGPIATQKPALPDAWDNDDPRPDTPTFQRPHVSTGMGPTLVARRIADQALGALNMPVGRKPLAPDAGAYFYENAFEAIPATLPYRPLTVDGHGARRHPRPTVHGTQTAIVVSNGAPQLTDRDHRIKVQFPWQRGGNAGNRLPHPSGDDNAPATDAAWTWVRVAGPWAGDNWGSVFVPRQGQEVLVAFLEGDIDRPVVIGAVYNGQGQADAAHNRIGTGAAGATGNAPAWFDGNEHPAVFTGLKSQQLADSQGGMGGYQQLRLDDTPGQGRAQAETTQFASGLTLGHLKGGSDNVRGAERGFGVELTTQASGALRAGAGLLLTTERGPQQLSADGAQAQLQQASQLLESLHGATKAQAATLPGEADTLPAQNALHTLQQTLQATQQGTAPGDGIGGGEGEAPGWSAPAIVASSPDGIVSVTPADQVWVSGTQTTLSAGQDLQWLTQGEAVLATAGGVLLYAHGSEAPEGKPNQERGIALHAAQGAVSARAHGQLARVAALTNVTIASTTADVMIASPSKHLLATAGGAYIRLHNGDIELGAPGVIEFKATRKEWGGAKKAQSPRPALPPAQRPRRFSQQLDIDELLLMDESLNGCPYIARLDDGTLYRGMINKDGLTGRIFTDQEQNMEILIGDGDWEAMEDVEHGDICTGDEQ